MASGSESSPGTPATKVLGAEGKPGVRMSGEPADLGAWRLLEPIGEGGMGVVWLAERADQTFRRQAAVKIVRPGFESAAMRERFLLERQTLGALEHPNIASLLDAGNTADGRPYFVMEFVDGVPVDQWCRDHGAGLEARVELFLQVCEAVQYAHGRLVVHRDIKPSNILVDSRGQARLLDFGIAKLLPAAGNDAAQGLTSASERLLTPQYAAPEQLLGQPVGTTADIYALGMLLYQLVSDELPYSLAGIGPAGMQRLICDEMPRPPSQRCRDPRRARRLRGDLDVITLMALRKEPARRYQTVEQLAADLRRWRDGLPVLARPDTAGYRLRKFARRNRLALAATLLVLLSLVVGLAASLWQAREAERARAVAEQRYRDVRSLATDMMFEVDAAIATLPGSSQARRLVVTRALSHLDRLSRELGRDPDLMADVATGYEKIADIQGSPYEANLGDVDGALDHARRALALREQATAFAPPPDDALVAALARSHLQLGTMLRQRSGDIEQALPEYQRAVELLEARMGKQVRGDALALAYADALNLLGDAHFAAARYARSREFQERAVALAQAVLATDGIDRAAWRRSRAVAILRLGTSMWWEGATPDDVIRLMEGAVKDFESLLAEDSGNARLTRQVAVANSVLAGVLAYERTIGEALPHVQRSLDLGERLLAFDPRNAQSRRDMARWQSGASDLLEAAESWVDAEQHSRYSLELIDGLIAEDPGQLELWNEGRSLRCRHAGLLLRAREKGAAATPFQPAAVCAHLVACTSALAREGLAAPSVDAARLEQVKEAAGRCPAG